jgi:hypothetical protein
LIAKKVDGDCTGCRLIRAGLCLQCAALVTAETLHRKPGKTINVSLCSGACAEALERYIAERSAP